MRSLSVWMIVVGLTLAGVQTASGQTFGIEAHNTLMPAAGAMGGVGISRPQDLTSGLNANPATLSQFRGTQFLMGGSWVEPTFTMTQTSDIPILAQDPLIEPYSAKSTAQGLPGGNIGVTQDFSEYDIPLTVGLGFVTSAGGMVDFRHVPESHGTNSGLVAFSVPVAAAVEVTDQLSVGASLALGIMFFDGPFVGIGGMTNDSALRGTLGANYALTEATSIGAYYQTKQSFTFDNAFVLNPGPGQTVSDVSLDLPQNVGLGVANSGLMEGRLLLAADVLYKLYDEADLFDAIYDNQWVVQVGAQYSLGSMRLRAGYVWAQNPLDPTPGPNLGGVIQPGDLPAVRYTQGLLAVTGEHRVSFGFGMVDALPGVDLDFMAGGMFRDTEQLGAFTTTSIASYWIGTAMTWRFGRGSCERLPAPDRWCEG